MFVVRALLLWYRCGFLILILWFLYFVVVLCLYLCVVVFIIDVFVWVNILFFEFCAERFYFSVEYRRVFFY